MNNLDQILGLGKKNQTLLQSESSNSVQEKKESKNFEGVMEEHWDGNNSERQVLSKSKNDNLNNDKINKAKSDKLKAKNKDKDENDKNEDSVSSNKDLQAKETKVSEGKEKDESEDQKLNDAQESDSKELSKSEDKEVSSLQAEESYLALFVQELLQTSNQNTPPATCNEQKTEALSEVGEETNVENVGKANSDPQMISKGFGEENIEKNIKIESTVQTQIENLIQTKELPTQQKMEEATPQVFEISTKEQLDEKRSEIESGKEKDQNADVLEQAKEVAAFLSKEIKSPQKEKQSEEIIDLSLKQFTQEKSIPKELSKVQEKNPLPLELDLSVDLNKLSEDLKSNFDKTLLSQNPQFAVAKETLMPSGSLSVDSYVKNQIPNFKPEEMSAIHKQLVDSFQMSVKGKENHAELQLTPPDWGRINIQMNVENKNELKVHMVVENPNVRQLLEQSTYELKQAMASSGLGFSNINVGVGSESSSNWKEKKELSEIDRSVEVLKKKVLVQTPYRWINSGTSGVDQLV